MKANSIFQTKTKDYDEYITLITGLFILSLGVSLMVKANLGSTPITTLSIGISNISRFKVGTSNTFINATLFIIGLIFGRKYIGIGSIITVFALGPMINFWSLLINYFAFFSKISPYVIFILGIVFNSYGIAYYIETDLGMGPYEIVVEILYERSGWSYTLSKLLTDGTILLLGYSLGAIVSIGTIITIVLSSNLITFFRSINRRIIHEKVIK